MVTDTNSWSKFYLKDIKFIQYLNIMSLECDRIQQTKGK
jgi:hypothetical protein